VSPGGIFIGLGSNLGNRERHLRMALTELEERGDIRVLCCSSLHETEPVGGPAGQGRFLNAVAELDTSLSPRALLDRMHELEHGHGRRRTVRFGPRTLDLDLLLYRQVVTNEPGLTIPHPRMWQRDFVMRPLGEVCEPGRLLAVCHLQPASRAAC
jgi:2-amino-4-hydroxy-6-hydroxymethyldihydropteridine diphosphokinase